MITIIPALYVCKGNYGLLFKKPKARDFVTIILCLIGYFAYGVLVAAILSHVLGYPVTGDAIVAKYQNPTLFLVISDFFQLMGEELFKVFILLMVMYAVYRFTQNRGLAITLAIIVTLFVFGIAHSRAYSGRLLQILLIQGLGSIFDLYAYMKTKNVMVSYILHLLIDFIPLTVLTLGSMA